MKKIGFLLLAVFLTGVTVTQAQKKQYAIYAVAFYNLENLFDTINQPNTNDEEFTPSGSYRWGGLKYRNKLNNLAYAISNFATDNSSPFKLKNGPAVIGVSEIENEQVLEDLIHTGELSKRNYGIVHYDSPDFRGIDVGLIYDKDQFTLESSRSARLHTPQFPNLRTRDQLVVSGILAGERVHFIVNHWPSRLGGEKQSSPKREAAAAFSGRPRLESHHYGRPQRRPVEPQLQNRIRGQKETTRSSGWRIFQYHVGNVRQRHRHVGL